jgi:adenine-specific DNA-methyltransferase
VADTDCVSRQQRPSAKPRIPADRSESLLEQQRVVACIYDPNRIQAERVGFENRLNYFHARGRGLRMDLAKGLAAFLNSTLVDVYFRQFNGHTQVNATDLRNFRS